MAIYDALNIRWLDLFSRWGASKPTTDGNHIMRCPFPEHKDVNPSFVFSALTGLWNCHGCGKSGNASQIIQQLDGLSEQLANEYLLALGGVVKKEKKLSREPLTVFSYARMKKFSVDFLIKLKVNDTLFKKQSAVLIPYFDSNGTLTAERYRTGGHPKFAWGSNNMLSLYGLWLKLNLESDWCVVVEGESDCHTLWQYEIPTYGCPGANNFKPDFPSSIPHIKKVFVMVEPSDEKQNAGEKFLLSVLTAQWGSDVEFYRIETSTLGFKDPSDMHLESENFVSQWKDVMDGAKKIDKPTVKSLSNSFGSCPVKFVIPQGYSFSDIGIFNYAEDGTAKLITTTPICIDSIHSEADGIEYARVCYRHRSKGWVYSIVKRGDLLSARKFSELADRGLDISDSTARHMTMYMSELIRVNTDIPFKSEIRRGGWNKAFTEFAPLLINSNSFIDTTVFKGFDTAGSRTKWIDCAVKARENIYVRAVMAAYACSAIMPIVGVRTFFFHIFNQASGAGKSCAQKLACSLYGNPAEIIKTFNSTVVGFERAAATNNHIGLVLDEYQMLNEVEKEKFVNEIYKVVGEVSRTRSNIKLQSVPTDNWNLSIVTSGENPLNERSKLQGVRSRVIECYGRPFDDDKQARNTHLCIGENYGHIGASYLGYIKGNRTGIIARFREVEEIMRPLLNSHRGAMISHSPILSAIFLADEILSIWLPGRPIKPSEFLKSIYAYESAKVPIVTQISELFIGWIAKHTNRIPRKHDIVLSSNILGWTDGDKVFLLSGCLDEFAHDLNLSRYSVSTQLKDKGILAKATERHPKIKGHVCNGYRLLEGVEM
jgi:hypothetical protein